jgi:hypothetical protein
MCLEERTGFGVYTLGDTAIDDHFALPMRFGKITWERRPVFIALSVGLTTHYDSAARMADRDTERWGRDVS